MDKSRKNKVPTDFESFLNPNESSESLSSNPDAWVQPEMLRRISQKISNDSDNQFQSGV